MDDQDSLTIPPAGLQESQLFREEKLSTIAVLDSLLTRFDVMALMKQRIAQAGLDWPVGRVMAGMLLIFAVTLAILRNFLPWLGAIAGALALGYIPYGYIGPQRRKRFEK